MKYAATSPPGFFTLVFITGLSILSLNMFLPSLSNIAQEYQANYSIVSLSVAGYLGITAVLQLIIGPLSDRFGRRPVLLAGLAIFILASLGCMLAGDIRYLELPGFSCAAGSDNRRRGFAIRNNPRLCARAGGGKPDGLRLHGNGGRTDAGANGWRSTG
jgi:MFS family permease